MKQIEQLTDSVFYIMAALTQPRHGYAVMTLIEETTNGTVKIGPASMYTIIKKLLNQDLIYLYDDGDSRRKVYLLTDKGREVLREDVHRKKVMIQMAENGLGEDEG
ncbi:helix-turn-helix transcriptional regulator [Bacillus sp. FJAT-27251]|uniref:PadR family transcriptional regulator n=1 Tax=Bacillus sp. FJAT-27251 TaxID=1684142 RepID=UPI0006A7BED5|nr:helix-turn-helix transcriptional regulator [Bacillus sp. FJAT-27251]